MDRKTERILSDFRSPDELTPDELRERFAAREKYPAEYLQAQERRDALARDEEDRAAALDSWIRSGGDPKVFDKEWKTISTEAKRIRMQEAQQAARLSFAKYGRERF